VTRWVESPGGILVPADDELLGPVDDGVDEELGTYGICRACGCTEELPCVLEGLDPSGVDDTHCAWIDETHTLCNGCV